MFQESQPEVWILLILLKINDFEWFWIEFIIKSEFIWEKFHNYVCYEGLLCPIFYEAYPMLQRIFWSNRVRFVGQIMIEKRDISITECLPFYGTLDLFTHV